MNTTLPESPTAPTPRARSSGFHFGDWLFRSLCQTAGLSIILVSALLVVVLVWQSLPALEHARELGIFTTTAWVPDPPEGKPQQFGIWAFVFGTVVTSILAMIVAVPLGVGSAAFLAEIAPGWLRRLGSFLVELLAAIPSVVYGFWGLMFVGPFMQKVFNALGATDVSGTGILSASLILAIMVVPYITAIAFDTCRAVPRSQREGALALGASRWQMIWSAVLPYARPGIIAACFLALGRALGETMAVTMLIGNSRVIDWSIFAKGDSIASIIANQLNEANNSTHRSALVFLGLVLMLITAILNITGRLMIRRLGKARGRAKLAPADAAPADEAQVRTAAPAAPLKVAPGRRAERINAVMTGVLGLCLAGSVGPLFLILGYVAYRGVTAINVEFFTEMPPGRMADFSGGLRHAIYGSATMVGIATLFAVPIGIFAAIYLAEYRTHRLTGPVRFIAEILGGVPSIIIGIFGYAMLVRPPWSNDPYGFSAWAGAFSLAVMMLPIVIRASEEAIKLVPQALRHASYALGAAYWQTVVRVTVPAALPAIITGVFLAVGRIAGETAPLLLTAGGSELVARSPSDPTAFLPYYIYTYGSSGYEAAESKAWAAAFVLLSVIMVLNVGIRYISGQRVVAAARGD